MWNKLKQQIESYAPKAKRYKLAKEWALNRVREMEKEMAFEQFFNANTCMATREETLLKGCYSVVNYIKTHKDTTQPDVLRSALLIIHRLSHEIWAQSPEGHAAIEKALNEEKARARVKAERMEKLRYAATVCLSYNC